MKIMRYLMISIASLGCLAPGASHAHHSISEYDSSKMVELEGRVVSKLWRNPHVILNVATSVDGEEVIWKLEAAAVSSHSRRGIDSDQVRVGDLVRAAGWVSTRRANDMALFHLLLPNDQELLMRGNSVPLWPEANLFALQTEVEPAKAASATADGIFRVWTPGNQGMGVWFFADLDKYPLTKIALEKQAQWDEYEDNPQLKYIAPGMPATMGNPYPSEFVRVGNNIEFHAEEFDVVRTIHMDGSAVEPNSDSPMGFSVGHWENDGTLVVSTTKINWPYLNRRGIPQSESVETRERFTLDEDSGRLDYQLTITDSETLTEPYVVSTFWVWRPGEEVNAFDCTMEE